MPLLDADIRQKADMERRRALPLRYFRNEALRWIGSAVLFVAVLLTRVWLVPWRPTDGSQLTGVLFCVCVLPFAVLSGVLAYVRLRDWQWARQRDAMEQ